MWLGRTWGLVLRLVVRGVGRRRRCLGVFLFLSWRRCIVRLLGLLDADVGVSRLSSEGYRHDVTVVASMVEVAKGFEYLWSMWVCDTVMVVKCASDSDVEDPG